MQFSQCLTAQFWQLMYLWWQMLIPGQQRQRPPHLGDCVQNGHLLPRGVITCSCGSNEGFCLCCVQGGHCAMDSLLLELPSWQGAPACLPWSRPLQGCHA